ncbi:MAG TPA: hypothetical protein VHC67_03230 [Gaiellaceae bacterium]|nr:hypothetical protein [Gaiellaceae bacterium]
MCAGHRNKIEAGSCSGCALAVTTTARLSAILDCENTNERGAEMYDLSEIEFESEEFEESEEDARIYAWRVEQLSGLGLSEVIASLVASFVDWHEIAGLVERGCSPELALEIVR